jgi:DNA invertase Pin-like site-specific DNA recombinase
MEDADAKTALRRAAQYVRMSTDHQRYSIDNQVDGIAAYAAQHGLEVVRTYADAGRSGLTINGRTGLQDLLACVVSGEADFEALLVFDISRWGRFQDSDESGYYEFMCRRAGVQVIYVAEPFDNDGSPMATLFKGIKRLMAGEFSRELSAKVHKGQLRIARLGFSPGAGAPYGIRRHLYRADGTFRQVLESGERKSVHDDRVVWAPGPARETRAVKLIFDLFADAEWRTPRIAEYLNDQGLRWTEGRKWTVFSVWRVLRNERYAGVAIFNRRRARLGQKVSFNPPDLWVVRQEDGLVSREQFDRADALIMSRRRRHTPSDEEMIGGLRRLLEREGKLTAMLVEDEPGIPGPRVYQQRFGSLPKAYAMVGYISTRADTRSQTRKHTDILRQRIDADLQCALSESGAPYIKLTRPGHFRIGDRRVCVSVAPVESDSRPSDRWRIPVVLRQPGDLNLIARASPEADRVIDYFLVPGDSELLKHVQIGPKTASAFPVVLMRRDI